MTHQESRERRRKVADFAAQHGMEAACVEFGVGIHIVYAAAKENGVRIARTKAHPRERAGIAFKVLHDLLHTEDPMKTIGERFGMSRQRIEQIALAATKAGFDVRGKRPR